MGLEIASDLISQDCQHNLWHNYHLTSELENSLEHQELTNTFVPPMYNRYMVNGWIHLQQLDGNMNQSVFYITPLDLNLFGTPWINAFNLWSDPKNSICNQILGEVSSQGQSSRKVAILLKTTRIQYKEQTEVFKTFCRRTCDHMGIFGNFSKRNYILIEMRRKTPKIWLAKVKAVSTACVPKR